MLGLRRVFGSAGFSFNTKRSVQVERSSDFPRRRTPTKPFGASQPELMTFDIMTITREIIMTFDIADFSDITDFTTSACSRSLLPSRGTPHSTALCTIRTACTAQHIVGQLCAHLCDMRCASPHSFQTRTAPLPAVPHRGITARSSGGGCKLHARCMAARQTTPLSPLTKTQARRAQPAHSLNISKRLPHMAGHSARSGSSAC